MRYLQIITFVFESVYLSRFFVDLSGFFHFYEYNVKRYMVYRLAYFAYRFLENLVPILFITLYGEGVLFVNVSLYYT